MGIPVPVTAVFCDPYLVTEEGTWEGWGYKGYRMYLAGRG
jgi:hypothetical protein